MLKGLQTSSYVLIKHVNMQVFFIRHVPVKQSCYCKFLSRSVCSTIMFAASCKQKTSPFIKKEIGMNRPLLCFLNMQFKRKSSLTADILKIQYFSNLASGHGDFIYHSLHISFYSFTFLIHKLADRNLQRVLRMLAQ